MIKLNQSRKFRKYYYKLIQEVLHFLRLNILMIKMPLLYQSAKMQSYDIDNNEYIVIF